VYLADRKVEIAAAKASTRYAEDQRATLGAERDKARLDARTREADAARSDADTARATAAAARRDASDMQRQLDELKAEATDRGLVLTLGDILFATGKSDVKVGAASNLNKLATFLGQYPDRTVAIEGHTDNVGSDDLNQALSQRRADSVKSYLMQQGISAQRIAASGMGESQPVTDNDSATGRQLNRRVVVVIDNPAPAPAAVTTR
jgi:outer membrane protein OmpA-like peptidoglycan-associated protein